MALDLTPDDAGFIAEEIGARRLVFFTNDDGRWRPVRGCRVAAAYGLDGSQALEADVDPTLVRRSPAHGGVYRVAALTSNELPRDEACARASHVAGAVEMDRRETAEANDADVPAAALLLTIDSPPMIRAATRTHLTTQLPGDWVLDTNQNAPFCTLPCDVWMLPSHESVARERSGTSAVYLPDNSAPPSSITITMGKERKEPVLGWLAFGFGVAATGFGVAATYAVWSGPSSSSTSLSGTMQAGADQLAGMVLMPLLTAGIACLAGWGLWEVLRAPRDVPVAKRELGSRLLRCATGACSF